MRLDGGMSRAQRALLFRFSPAPRARHGQYTFQREFMGLHTDIIQDYQLEGWSILLFWASFAQSENQNGTEQFVASQSKFRCAPISKCAPLTQLGWYVRPQMQ
jgi:hypothetical protein